MKLDWLARDLDALTTSDGRLNGSADMHRRCLASLESVSAFLARRASAM
jgi:hypothetical protein